MRIINQDRTMSFEFSKIDLVVQDTVIYAKQGNNSSPLGMYDSEARCKEIFNDIHNAYSNSVIASTNVMKEQVELSTLKMSGVLKVYSVNEPSIECVNYENTVYLMPEV